MTGFLKRQEIRVKIITGYTSIFILTSILGGMFIYFQVEKNINIIQSVYNRHAAGRLNESQAKELWANRPFPPQLFRADIPDTQM